MFLPEESSMPRVPEVAEPMNQPKLVQTSGRDVKILSPDRRTIVFPSSEEGLDVMFRVPASRLALMVAISAFVALRVPPMARNSVTPLANSSLRSACYILLW